MKKLFTICLFINYFSHAGTFDNPKNLKVLDKNISPLELRNTMKNFALSLGVRCTHCHDGEESQPFNTINFASDKKQNKKTARMMLKMIEKMNEKYISKIENNSEIIECSTCHRGQDKPRLTNNLLFKEYQSNGVQASLDKYDVLKGKYFGSHTHDFSEKMLLDVASKVQVNSPESAMKIYLKNLEIFPKSQQTLFSIARFYHNQIQTKEALSYYLKAQEIRSSPWLDKTIIELKNELKN